MKKIKIKGKIIEVKECRSILSKARGLMFKKQSKPLLFVFNKPTKQSIHSFFCPAFIAIWLNKGKIIDEKVVKPFCFYIKPKEPFTHLVEIPLGNNNNDFGISDDNRKI